MLGAILAFIFSGFVIGALARWAVPGPDPMPIWLTTLFGLAGSVIGGAVTLAVIGRTSNIGRGDYFAVILAEIIATSILIVLYRRYVQGRPITGPEAHKLPKKGVGIDSLRQRLQQMGIDPEAIGTPGADPRLHVGSTGEGKTALLQKLDELHDEGLLTDEEYLEKRAEVLRRES